MLGNITEIELHNFMTFNHLKCKPGSRLNLVIGPNGSGKSSLVCAIALGLGGEPQVGYCQIACLVVMLSRVLIRVYKVGIFVFSAAREGNECWCVCEAWRGIWIYKNYPERGQERRGDKHYSEN